MSPLFHNTYGEKGPWLVILHGLFGSGDNWATLARRWQTEVRVLVIDMPNHGKSPHNQDFNYPAMAAEVKETIENICREPVVLLGHSMGGKTAMFLACMEPAWVKKLLVADIAPRYYPVHHQKIIDALLSLQPEKYTRRAEAEQAFAAYGIDPPSAQFLLKNLYRTEEGTMAWRFNLPVIAKNIEQVGLALPEQATYHGPSLFLHGGRSPYVLAEDHATIFHHFPNAHIQTIPNAGHWIHADQPESMYQMVLDFIHHDPI